MPLNPFSVFSEQIEFKLIFHFYILIQLSKIKFLRIFILLQKSLFKVGDGFFKFLQKILKNL